MDFLDKCWLLYWPFQTIKIWSSLGLTASVVKSDYFVAFIFICLNHEDMVRQPMFLHLIVLWLLFYLSETRNSRYAYVLFF